MVDFWGWEVRDDTAPARWYADALAPPFDRRPFRVDAVVPAAYPAHVRLAHPARDASDVRVLLREIDGPDELRWEGDQRFTHQLGWTYANGRGWTHCTPNIGSLDPVDLGCLVESLGEHTSRSDEIWALMWPGWGGPTQSLWEHRHVIRIGREQYTLLRGGLDQLEHLVRSCGQSPAYWWPEDRAWVVGTDIDAFATYIACTAAVADRLQSDRRIDAGPASPDDSIYPPEPDRAG